jgi:curved DNA-binding protein CbpA
MSHGYYAVLGVSSDASPEVIKNAYIAGVRKHSPEKDPSGNQKVREAYDVLKDPSQRKKYDAQSLYGEELSRLWTLAGKHHENKNYKEEAKALKRILIISEVNSQAWIKLSWCYLIDGIYDEAVKVAQSLVKRSPDDSKNWFNLGFIFECYAYQFQIEDKKRSINYDEARNNYNIAVKMDLGNCQYYMAIARCFAEERKWTNAFLWAEKAIDSHKKPAANGPIWMHFFIH